MMIDDVDDNDDDGDKIMSVVVEADDQDNLFKRKKAAFSLNFSSSSTVCELKRIKKVTTVASPER